MAKEFQLNQEDSIVLARSWKKISISAHTIRKNHKYQQFQKVFLVKKMAKITLRLMVKLWESLLNILLQNFIALKVTTKMMNSDSKCV